MKEINIFGIYIAPFAGELVVAIVLFFFLRGWLDRIEIQRWVWHRQLFDTAIFLILLSLIGLMF
jgi:protein AaeX